MTAPLKVIGKAVALKRGHYHDVNGAVRVVPEGATFDLLEGKPTKGLWFKVLPPEKKSKAPAGEDLA